MTYAISPSGLIHRIADDPRGTENYVSAQCGSWIDRSSWTFFALKDGQVGLDSRAPEGLTCDRCFKPVVMGA